MVARLTWQALSPVSHGLTGSDTANDWLDSLVSFLSGISALSVVTDSRSAGADSWIEYQITGTGLRVLFVASPSASTDSTNFGGETAGDTTSLYVAIAQDVTGNAAPTTNTGGCWTGGLQTGLQLLFDPGASGPSSTVYGNNVPKWRCIYAADVIYFDLESTGNSGIPICCLLGNWVIGLNGELDVPHLLTGNNAPNAGPTAVTAWASSSDLIFINGSTNSWRCVRATDESFADAEAYNAASRMLSYGSGLIDADADPMYLESIDIHHGSSSFISAGTYRQIKVGPPRDGYGYLSKGGAKFAYFASPFSSTNADTIYFEL